MGDHYGYGWCVVNSHLASQRRDNGTLADVLHVHNNNIVCLTSWLIKVLVPRASVILHNVVGPPSAAQRHIFAALDVSEAHEDFAVSDFLSFVLLTGSCFLEQSVMFQILITTWYSVISLSVLVQDMRRRDFPTCIDVFCCSRQSVAPDNLLNSNIVVDLLSTLQSRDCVTQPLLEEAVTDHANLFRACQVRVHHHVRVPKFVVGARVCSMHVSLRAQARY